MCDIAHQTGLPRALYRSAAFCNDASVSNLVPIFGLAAHLGRGMQRVATDAIIGRLRSLPRSINELDAQASRRSCSDG